MTPSACSLYDKIKLYTLKRGYAPEVKEVFSGGDELSELTENGYIEIHSCKVEGFASKIKTIRILK